MRIYMQTAATETSQPRFYQLHLGPDLLDGWMLTKEWGAQGSPGRVQKKYYATPEEAQKALIDARDQQIKRGYRIVFMEGQANPL